MEWFAGNWPLVLVALAGVIVITAIVRKLAKLAFLGAAVAAVGLFLWPLVTG